MAGGRGQVLQGVRGQAAGGSDGQQAAAAGGVPGNIRGGTELCGQCVVAVAVSMVMWGRAS